MTVEHAVPAGDPARRPRRDRPQPAGARVRRHRDRRRLRRHVPRRADARHRRRDPRRDLPPHARAALPRHLPHPRPRGSHRRAAVRARRVQRAGLRHAAHASASCASGCASTSCRRRSRPTAASRSGRAVRRRAVRRDALHPRRGRARDPHARSAPSSTPATSSSTRRRSTAGCPTSAASPSSGDEGVLLLLSDSTNVEHAGVTPLGAHGRRAPRAASSARPTGRVVVTTFSSHIHRMQQVIDLAVRFGRQVALVGRSLVSHIADGARPRAAAGSPTARWSISARLRDLPRARGHAASRPAARPRLPRRWCGSRWTRTSRSQLSARRLGGPLVAHHPGQRARDLEPGEPPLPARRDVHYDRQRADPRLRPRLAGGAEAGAQPGAAAVLRARARRVPPPRAPHPPRDARSACPPSGCHLLEDGDVLELTADGADRAGPGAGRPRVRRRQGRRRRRGRRAARPPPPLRGRLRPRGAGDRPAVRRDRRRARSGVTRGGRGRGQPGGPRGRPERGPERARRASTPSRGPIRPRSRRRSARRCKRYFKRFDRRPVILPFVLEM